MTLQKKGRERCESYTIRNEIVYVCGKWKGHYGTHRMSVSWTKGVQD